jgi:hypothetical protein
MKDVRGELKPLTKAERAEIEAMLEVLANTRSGGRLHELVELLLGAEAFWRESVKQVSEPFITDGYGSNPVECDYCGAAYQTADCHTEECPWLLAQAAGVEEE